MQLNSMKNWDYTNTFSDPQNVWEEITPKLEVKNLILTKNTNKKKTDKLKGG